MGEGARAAIWAEQNGMDFADMGGEHWVQFLQEDSAEEASYRSRVSRRVCPICNKKLANHAAALAHLDAVHGSKIAARPDWHERITNWKESAP